MHTEQSQDYCADVMDALYHISAHRSFAIGGSIDSPPLSKLKITGVGSMPLPLSAQNAGLVKRQARKVTFRNGRGNAWEIKSSKIQLTKDWNDKIQHVARESARLMGFIDEVEGRLFKMVLDEADGTANLVMDKTKQEGTLGTLVVPLSAGSGGALEVKHQGESKFFPFKTESSSEFFFAAFCSDCDLQLHKHACGWRMFLLYNLVKVASEPVPETTSSTEEKVFRVVEQLLRNAARDWIADVDAAPSKLVIPLQHRYAKTKLSFSELKGQDRTLVKVLQDCTSAARSNLFEVALALMNLPPHPDDTPKIETWVAPDGTPNAFDGLKIDVKGEMLGTSDPFEGKPSPEEDKNHQKSPTWRSISRRAAVVFWPFPHTAPALLPVKACFEWVATRASQRVLEPEGEQLLAAAAQHKILSSDNTACGVESLLEGCVTFLDARRAAALAMATHPRLGSASVAMCLSTELVARIAQLADRERALTMADGSCVSVKDTVQYLCSLMSRRLSSEIDVSSMLGKATFKNLTAAVAHFGWEELSREVLPIIRNSPWGRAGDIAQFALLLNDVDGAAADEVATEVVASLVRVTKPTVWTLQVPDAISVSRMCAMTDARVMSRQWSSDGVPPEESLSWQYLSALAQHADAEVLTEAVNAMPHSLAVDKAIAAFPDKLSSIDRAMGIA